MPIEIGVWRITDKVEKVEFSSIETENKLEGILAGNLAILDSDLLLIGSQVVTGYDKVIDLLAVDSQGDLVVIELKRGQTPREVVAQLLDYASWVQSLAYEDITTLYSDNHNGAKFEKAFSERFGVVPPESLNENHRLVVVATELDNSTERIIDYLSSGYGVPINAVFFRHFRDNEDEYLARTWLIDPHQVDIQTGKSSRGKKETWNGRDWYASFGIGERYGDRRNWEDAVKYGFISAGGGKWYSNTLRLLPVGGRVFVYVPQKGYVGVGIVKEKSVRVRDFIVKYEGEERPILDVPLKAPNMSDGAEDEDLSEYLVRVEWLKTVPLEKAVWEKGMFANQNSACKLRNKFTIEKLTRLFDLGDE